MDDLRRSIQLRALILDTDIGFLQSDPKPLGSFKRKFTNEVDKEIANEQSFRQSSYHDTMVKRVDAGKHNI